MNEENAAVRLLQPEHRLLNTPNRIGTDDFAGWVQERGLYFVSQADPRYEHLLGMHDQGEAELDGGLITTTLGKGRFIYAPWRFPPIARRGSRGCQIVGQSFGQGRCHQR